MCVVASLCIAWPWRAPATAQEKPVPVSQKWEYKVVQVSDAVLFKDDFNKLGDEGWELCSGVGWLDDKDVLSPFRGRYVFKRPKR
jgi:hypothetical protein